MTRPSFADQSSDDDDARVDRHSTESKEHSNFILDHGIRLSTGQDVVSESQKADDQVGGKCGLEKCIR